MYNTLAMRSVDLYEIPETSICLSRDIINNMKLFIIHSLCTSHWLTSNSLFNALSNSIRYVLNIKTHPLTTMVLKMVKNKMTLKPKWEWN